MDMEKKVKTLQMFYAGALADSVFRLGKEGVLEKVTAEKRLEQLAGGKARAAQLGIKRPQDVFAVLSELFGCADWSMEEVPDGFVATSSQCLLCGLSKRLGAESPCPIYCLDPMEGLVKGLDEQAEWNVMSTLWNAGECKITVKTGK